MYKVIVDGIIVSIHQSLAAALKEAKTYPDNLTVEVWK